MPNNTLFRTRIKFCGLTRAGDVRLAGELGVDAIGFVFAPRSSRRLKVNEARALRVAIAPLVDLVAVFRDNPQEEVREVVAQLRPALLQFHGEEDDGWCRSFGVPYVKAVSLHADAAPGDARELHLRFPHASAFIFDSHPPGGDGGSGLPFDWERIPPGMLKPFAVSGGLHPGNVFAAIQATRPWGVDVSSGIEDAPGQKDGHLMRHFMEEARRADCVKLKDASDDIDSCYACGR